MITEHKTQPYDNGMVSDFNNGVTLYCGIGLG